MWVYNGAPALEPKGGLEMEEGTTQGILLLSDISGYTEFVRRHVRSASHARQITVRLLKAIVSASGPPLSVGELEGDAVFFYALGAEEELPELAKSVVGRTGRTPCVSDRPGTAQSARITDDPQSHERL